MTDENTLTIDKKREKEPTGEQAAPREAISVPAEQESPEKKKRTTGNKIFDWAVYSSIAWVGVSVVSLALANTAMNGKGKLNAVVSWGSNKFEKALNKTVLKNNPEAAKSWADNVSLYTVLASGGTLLTPLIKWMEDNRLKLSGKIDNLIGSAPPSDESIAKEPKQTWRSVMSGRALAVGTGLATLVTIGPQRLDGISESFGKPVAKAWMSISPKSNPKVVKDWAKMATFDVFFTAITASIMYAFSRCVAKKHGKEIDADEALLTLDPATPTPQKPQLLDREAPPKTAPRRQYADTIAPREKKTVAPAEHYTQRLAAESAQPAHHMV